MALSSYYEDDQDAEVEEDAAVKSSSSQPAQDSASLVAASNDQSKTDAKNSNKKYNVGGSRIMTLNNMASDDEEDDGTGQVNSLIISNNLSSQLICNAQNWQAFYAGGSDSSGQQVLGPSRKNNKDFVSNIFKSAKESGAEVVENPHPSRPSGSRRFVWMV